MKRINILAGVLLAVTFMAALVSCVPVKEKPKAQIPVPKSLGSTATESSEAQPNWKDVPALKDAYKNYFDYFGFAIPETQLKDPTIMEGASYQASCFTCENECKPDFIFNWSKPTSVVDFKGEDGHLYKVPESLSGFTRLSQILEIARDNNMKMRGHVLVWHNQTPDWFFKKNYTSGEPYVEKEEMNARLEWYIKSVLEFVKSWEDIYNGGKRIIITWDVVNEACTDGAWTDNPLRTTSHWYNIYKDDTFIINAFRYANRYAPADVKLAYNDYSSYSPSKTKAICKVVEHIQATKDARIDVVGMQSHVSMTYPTLLDYEKAVQTFLALGVDVQVTEMEIAFGGKLANQEALGELYAQYFELFLKYRKLPGKNGISGVTLWGTKDEASWVRNNADAVNKLQRPLLFEKDYECKPAFFSVLETAQNYK
ncbi:MAG: endo-1,4-beta-xylanase [Treponema sp.]|nr:endo-1,4-beta-xylanase [Treponema sp.]